MGRYLEVSDLQAFAPDISVTKASAMIDDAEYMALLVAPCLDYDDADYDLSDNRQGAVRAILRGVDVALERGRYWRVPAADHWPVRGDGGYPAAAAGHVLAVGDRTAAIHLQCRRAQRWRIRGRHNRLRMRPRRHLLHQLRRTYCSCGADLTNYEYPLYETEGQWP